MYTLTHARTRTHTHARAPTHVPHARTVCALGAVRRLNGECFLFGLPGNTHSRKAKRDDAIHRFRTDPQVKVFVMSLKAGGVGLNLTEASLVVLLDPWCVRLRPCRSDVHSPCARVALSVCVAVSLALSRPS
jgi:hypothetical protein